MLEFRLQGLGNYDYSICLMFFCEYLELLFSFVRGYLAIYGELILSRCGIHV